jgi:hypothetical protein
VMPSLKSSVWKQMRWARVSKPSCPPREVGPGDMLDLDLGGRPQLLRWYNNRGLVTSSRYCIGDGYL